MEPVKTEHLQELHLHSDPRFQYTSQVYFDLTKEYGIVSFIPRHGNCYDNTLTESLFGIIKAEHIYRHKLETFEEANKMIDDHLLLQPRTHPTKNRTVSAFASSVRLRLSPHMRGYKHSPKNNILLSTNNATSRSIHACCPLTLILTYLRLNRFV